MSKPRVFHAIDMPNEQFLMLIDGPPLELNPTRKYFTLVALEAYDTVVQERDAIRKQDVDYLDTIGELMSEKAALAAQLAEMNCAHTIEYFDREMAEKRIERLEAQLAEAKAGSSELIERVQDARRGWQAKAERLERALARVLRAVDKNTSHDFFEYCKGKAELEAGE